MRDQDMKLTVKSLPVEPYVVQFNEKEICWIPPVHNNFANFRLHNSDRQLIRVLASALETHQLDFVGLSVSNQ